MQWKEVRGIKVSSEGWVETQHKGPRLPSHNISGYRELALNGKKVRVHTLVAEAFIGPRPSPDHTVDHINHDRGDNRVCNLRWASKAEQLANQKSMDLSTHKANNPVEYRRVGDVNWTLCRSQNHASRLLGCLGSHISLCVNGKRNTHAGYEFRRPPVEEIDGEVWRECDTFEVSNMGRIKHKSSPPFKPVAARGMPYAMFSNHAVHRIVAWAFLGDPPFDGATIDHCNRDKSDNRASNLRWASPKEQRANQDHKKGVVTHSKRVRVNIQRGFHFESALEAEREVLVLSQSIAKCASGKRARAGGVVWEYA